MTSAAAANAIILTPPTVDVKSRKRGEHWTSDKQTGFQNPWPSAGQWPGAWGLAKMIFTINAAGRNDPEYPAPPSLVPRMTPDFVNHPAGAMKSTWLGHACFLVEMPSSSGEKGKGVTILYDPAFSQRCSPIQSMGMTPRYTPVPAPVSDLPEIDAICVSHSHYDHMDLNTIKEIYVKHAARPPLIFVPLANAPVLKGIVPKECIVEMDWWENREVAVEGKGQVRITCTPSQHSCGRTPFDRDHTLWSSWTAQQITKEGKVGTSVWHGGDTGYCAVDSETHEVDPARPVCPAFKEIGERLGPFSLGLIPIGAYAPRVPLSIVHNAPIDAVRMFQDIKCRQAVGMHWGTWRMAAEPIAEPPKLLVKAREVVGLTEEQFGVCALGETRCYEA